MTMQLTETQFANFDNGRPDDMRCEDEFPPPRPISFSRWRADSWQQERQLIIDNQKRQRHHRLNVIKTIVLLVAVFGGTIAIALSMFSATHQTAEISTPRSEWQEGELPYLYQVDPAWANVQYAQGTVGDSGCGPTALAMAYVALTGKTDKDPAAMARYSSDHGYIIGGETSWDLMTDGARQLGLKSRELPADLTKVSAALRAGNPVICSVGPGDFTKKGHFIVLGAISDENFVTVHDPNSEERSQKQWELVRVLAQCRNIWELSV